MAKELKLLVWARKAPPTKAAPGTRIDRREEMAAIVSAGAKLRHDSGGRLIVLELPEGAEAALLKRLPGAKLLPIGPELEAAIPGLDPGEALFLEALRIRASASYRDAKRQRKFGESPEEKLLATGSCVRGY
jgi:hypothetical protein